MIKNKRFNKIIATLGPSIEKKWVLNKIDKYVDAYRIKLSHSRLTQTRQIIKTVRDINSKKVFIMDTKWPQIRTTNNDIKVKEWDIIQNWKEINIDYEFVDKIPENIHISFNNNSVQWIVKANKKWTLEIEISHWWIIKKWSSINFRWYEIELDFLTESDKKDIQFMIEEDICILSASFIKNSKDIDTLRKYIKENYDSVDIKIIAKIETQSAVNDIENIVDVADWIMVARWNLWLNTNIIDLPRIQKQITNIANLAWKPVILSKQTMPSMVSSNTPSRAEIDEVAYSIQNWVDIIMLSEETAIGQYPVETANMLNDIIVNYQKDITDQKFHRDDMSRYNKKWNEITNYILYNAKKIAYKLWVKIIVIPSSSWYSPAKIAWLKPQMTVLAFTNSDNIFKYCNLLFGVDGHKISSDDMSYEQLKNIVWETIQSKYRWKIKWEDRILIFRSTVAQNKKSMINSMEVIKFKDL